MIPTLRRTSYRCWESEYEVEWGGADHAGDLSPRPAPGCTGKLPAARQRGFSLIELMVVVAIMGALAAIAVPAFMKYIKKARTAEAGQFIRKIYDGARTYYLNPTQPGFSPVEPQFPSPSTAPTPALGDCCVQGGKCAAEQTQWQTDTWVAVKFSVPDAHYYSYSYITPDEFGDFTARANGDLDCDGFYSTFEMYGTIDAAMASGSSGSASMSRLMELE